MGYDLRSAAGAQLSFHAAAWSLLLGVAEAYGWTAQGTRPPERLDSGEWAGDYDTNDGASVVAGDAAAMAAALERALADPERSHKEKQISRFQNNLVREMEMASFGSAPDLDEYPELTTPDGALRELIEFLKSGSFTIE